MYQFLLRHHWHGTACLACEKGNEQTLSCQANGSKVLPLRVAVMAKKKEAKISSEEFIELWDVSML